MQFHTFRITHAFNFLFSLIIRGVGARDTDRVKECLSTLIFFPFFFYRMLWFGLGATFQNKHSKIPYKKHDFEVNSKVNFSGKKCPNRKNKATFTLKTFKIGIEKWPWFCDLTSFWPWNSLLKKKVHSLFGKLENPHFCHFFLVG